MPTIKLQVSNTVPARESYDIEFIQGMLNRMFISHHKYGKISEKDFDPIKNLKFRLKKYKETGNLEFLIDVANYAMIEFMFPVHKKAHWDSLTKEGQHHV